MDELVKQAYCEEMRRLLGEMRNLEVNSGATLRDFRRVAEKIRNIHAVLDSLDGTGVC